MSVSVSDLMQFLKHSSQSPLLWNTHVHCHVHKRLPFVHNLTFLGRSKGFMNFWICGPLVSGAVSPKSGRPPTIGCSRLIHSYPPYLEAVISACNPKTRHAFVTASLNRDRPIDFCVFIDVCLLLLNRNLCEEEKWSNSLGFCRQRPYVSVNFKLRLLVCLGPRKYWSRKPATYSVHPFSVTGHYQYLSVQSVQYRQPPVCIVHPCVVAGH